MCLSLVRVGQLSDWYELILLLEQYGVPYGYSPVIARNAARKDLSDDVLKRFIVATQKGYQMARVMEKRQDAVDALVPRCEPEQTEEFLKKSLESLSTYFGTNADSFGHMNKEKWEKWVGWLKEGGLIKDADLKVDELFSNEYLP